MFCINSSKENVDGAVSYIQTIINNSNSRGGRRDNKKQNSQSSYSKGELLDGEVEKILKVGALIKLPDGNIGMAHISKLANSRIENVEDVLNEHQSVKVQFIEQKRDGRISLALEGVRI